MDHILTVALNAAIDTTLTIPGRLKVGETHKVRDVLKLPGGKGLNVARVLLTMGLPVQATGLAGGPAGEFIKGGLAQAGIDSTFLPIAGTSRTCIAVVECDSHRVTEVNEPGPTITDSEAQAFLDLYEKLLPGAEAVVLSGSLPPGLPDDYYSLLMQRAHRAGVPSILDTSGDPLHLGIAACPLLVKPNATEAGQLLGREIHNVEDALYVGHSMRERGPQMAAITRGSEGAVLVTGMGAFLNYPDDSLAQIRRVLAPSARGNHVMGVAIYSYAATSVYGNYDFYNSTDLSSGLPRQPYAGGITTDAGLAERAHMFNRSFITELAHPDYYFDVQLGLVATQPVFTQPAPAPVVMPAAQ